jgi:hypothetical protein
MATNKNCSANFHGYCNFFSSVPQYARTSRMNSRCLEVHTRANAEFELLSSDVSHYI